MIQKRQRRTRAGKAYSVYRIRWHDADGRERSKTLPRGSTLRDAEAFEARIKLMKRTGELPLLDRGRETLAEFAEEWWEVYAGPNLARSTLDRYAELWNTHTLPRLGHFALRELTSESVSRFRGELESAGVGAPTVRKALTMIQGMLARAVEWQRVSVNPAAAVRKPPAARTREITVLAPEQVEQLRQVIRSNDVESRGHRDATLVSLLAYAGPRPWSEAIVARWRDLREHTLHVYAPKTRRHRSVEILSPLRADLMEFRLASGRPPDDAPIIPGAGGGWSAAQIRNWRRRVWKPALRAAGLDDHIVPYELRHTCASLLISEGRNTVER